MGITQTQHQRVELVAVVKGRKIQLALHLPQALQTQAVVVEVVAAVENLPPQVVQALSSFVILAQLSSSLVVH